MTIKKPLKGAPRLTLLALQRFAKNGDNPSQSDLARETGYVVRTIQYALHRLESQGYIRISRAEKKKSLRNTKRGVDK